MRADRLISFMMLLQSRGRMTAAELADELEVSERTIYRDVTALGISGVPIVTEQGPGGGISLMEQYRSDFTGLTKEEVQALFMLSIPAQLADLGLDRKLKDAMYKISAALPTTLRGYEQGVKKRIHIDSDGWTEGKKEVPTHLLMLQKVIWSENILEIDYRSQLGNRTGILSASVEPYGLAAKAGSWYLIAFRSDHMAVLQADRLIKVRICEEVFDRDSSFDLSAFWNGWCNENRGNQPQFRVQVKVSPELRPYLATAFGDLSIVNHVRDEVETGWSTWQVLFPSFNDARGRILALGASIKVINPKSLRLSISDFATQISELYKAE